MDTTDSPHWRVLTAIVADIRAGIYPPGGKLPSEHALAATHGVHRTAVTTATRILRFGGLLIGPAGGATCVTNEPMRTRALRWIDDAERTRAMNREAELG